MSDATMAEREAELIALQGAFDEYIASSRELEEELDAELAKMQERLAESTAANSALSSQLENISPQLNSLETALTSSRQKLKEEQKLRRAAEQAQDEADQRLRELEQSIQTVQEECDDIHEELAFKENELEETRLELEVDKQKLENDLADVKRELSKAERNAAPKSAPEATTSVDTDATVTAVDESYVRKLEEELELVTEQLIETEKRLSEVETELTDQADHLQTLLNEEGRNNNNEELIANLQAEVVELQEVKRKQNDELKVKVEELALSREEVALQAEELQAVEQDYEGAHKELLEERALHKSAISNMEIQLKETEVANKQSLGEAALLSTTVKDTNEKNNNLADQVSALECALENAKKDYQGVLDQLDSVNGRFDEARSEAERAGREAASEELRASMKLDADHEIGLVKETLSKLSEENSALQQKVDDAEMRLAAAKDSQEKEREEGSQVQSEVSKQLQLQLDRVKEEVLRKDKEMASLTETMNERLQKAEETVTHLESQLHSAKAQLAEAEGHLIVLRREKERMENAIPKSPVHEKSIASVDEAGAHSTPGAEDRGRSIVEDETADNMDGSQLRTPGHARPRSSSPSSVIRLELRLAEETKKYGSLEKDFHELEDQKRMSDVRIKRLEDDIKTLQKQLFSTNRESAVVTQMSRLSSLASADSGMDIISKEDIAGKRLDDIIGSRDHRLMAEELRSLDQKCNSQREYNAQLLSKMLHLQGSIQVYCRIRPMTIEEVQAGARCVVEPLSETEIGCFDNRTNKWKSFAFDRVWGPDQSQTSIFQDVEPLALSVVDGFNACIFAYGQTGSGKTYTMEGTQETNEYGISYRTIQKIFHLLNLRSQQQRAAELFVGNDDEEKERVSFAFSLNLGMLEIYNDEIYDLLASKGASMEEKREGAMKAGGKASLEIRRDKDGRVEVPNLTKEGVTSIEEVMSLLKRGNANRATAATDMNEHSSRSHMVLSVDVVSGVGETNRNKGTLYLVDLAGSERVRKSNVEGANLKEAGFINKSLSALGNVMEALDRKASHVPYRDSKLTSLLQNSLGGNSRTMMVVTTCPMDNSYDESVHALQFATRVRRIQIGAAQRNVTSKNLEETVKALTDEMRSLTRAKERTEGQLHTLKRDNARVQDKLQNLSKSRAQGRSDNKTLEVLKKNNDEMAERWQKEKASREETVDELDKAKKENRTNQQQLNRYKGKLQQLEQKLEDKERALERASDDLRQERNRKSAATVRSRRDEVLSSRVRSSAPSIQRPSTTKVATPSKLTPSKLSPSKTTPHQAVQNGALSETADPDVLEIRTKVLALLEKHDQAKVNRIDIIMDKFKGKEALLLEKMSQRYEAGESASTGTSSAATRNAMALQRHQERMRRINEKRQQKTSGLR